MASATGGIVEVVVEGQTGLLVPLEQRPGSIDPVDPEAFAGAFAERVNRLLADSELARRMGRAGRQRAIADFGWPAIAQQTVEVYGYAIAGRR